MPSAIEADANVFEINDFTVVTDLEIFVASLENILNDKFWSKKTNEQGAEVVYVARLYIVFICSVFRIRIMSGRAVTRTGESHTKDMILNWTTLRKIWTKKSLKKMEKARAQTCAI